MVAFVFLAAIAASLGMALAAPEVYPEVIPGPGMPTLAELNITSKDLYTMNDAHTSLDELDKRYELHCLRSGIPTCDLADAQACVNYLKNKGTTNCVVQGDNQVFCTAGSCSLGGSNIQGTGKPAISYCRDVACGAQQIVNSCRRNGQTEGDQAACGNGGLIAVIANKSWF